jgi:hypothetical protein
MTASKESSGEAPSTVENQEGRPRRRSPQGAYRPGEADERAVLVARADARRFGDLPQRNVVTGRHRREDHRHYRVARLERIAPQRGYRSREIPQWIWKPRRGHTRSRELANESQVTPRCTSLAGRITYCTEPGWVGLMESQNSPFTDTLREIDELMAEARRLRERINDELLRREEAPFFRERRNRYERHEPDRRSH